MCARHCFKGMKIINKTGFIFIVAPNLVSRLTKKGVNHRFGATDKAEKSLYFVSAVRSLCLAVRLWRNSFAFV